LILAGLEFHFLELLIIYYLTSKVLHLKMYRHHKLALTINLFPLILKFIIIILSIKLEKNTSNLIFVKYIWAIPLGVLIFLVIATIRSYANLKITKFMYKNVSLNKILMIYGLMGAIITSIFCIFTSIFNCNAGEIQDYFCNVSENNASKKFIDSFPIYRNTFQGYSNEDKTQIMLEIFAIIFGGLTFFIYKFSFLKVIQSFGPVLLVFSFPILFLFRKLILIINTLFISKSFFKNDVMGINKLNFFFDMIGDILSLISFFIFSEIVELNFLGLNDDTKRNLRRRGDNCEPKPKPELEILSEVNDLKKYNPIIYV
jgi:hypothetical protein